jgi:hypothetical protein
LKKVCCLGLYRLQYTLENGVSMQIGKRHKKKRESYQPVTERTVLGGVLHGVTVGSCEYFMQVIHRRWDR